jgi:uridine phosphorylase
MLDAPILEFDPSPTAVLEPLHHLKPIPDLPVRCVLCFFLDVLNELASTGEIVTIGGLGGELGVNPIYKVERDGAPVALLHPGVGAPLAAGYLEEMIALGSKTFIVCGGAGVLDSEIVVGHLMVPSAAIRDEGTSYHYLPASREVEPDADARLAIESVLSDRGIAYVSGKTWTTDGLYRETAARIKRRREEGCISVDMEAAALFAVARFRNVRLAQMLYAGDDVSGLSAWDHRNWTRHEVRTRLLWLAIEAALRTPVSEPESEASLDEA